MADHGNMFLLVTILVLLTILIIFGMKYFSAARQGRLRGAGEAAYRELAETAATAQSASAACLAALQTDLADLKGRLASVEKVLREVG